MRLSKLFTKTVREAPADETAKNAQLLIRGGFVFKNSAGIYSFLPLGWKVAQKIMNIVREEMNAIDGQEIFMPALIEKKYMEPTGRWNLDVGFFAKGLNDKELNYVLGWSHEEVLTAIAAKYISSYKDLPFAAYQIQTKFRNEPRAKSGLLRGREFMMKDLYSFHTDQKDLDKYYEKVREAYVKIFGRCGLKAVYTKAAGGVFTDKFTHEFQVLSDEGEDHILICPECKNAINIEIAGDNHQCPECRNLMDMKKSIEVGNIFDQGTKYSEALDLNFVDEKGDKHPVVMGAYGIGVSRLMATIVEIHNDEKGILWPENIAPYKAHLISLEQNEAADKIYNDLQKSGAEVLYDDREGKTAGEKFADADLIGCPVRVVVSKKTLEKNSVEIKKRNKKEAEFVPLDELADYLMA